MNRVRPAYLYVLFLSMALSAFIPQRALAHPSQPVYVNIEEVAPETYEVEWRLPPQFPSFNVPELVFPEGSEVLDTEVKIPERHRPTVNVTRYRCPGGLLGRDIHVVYPVVPPSMPCIFRLELLSGDVLNEIVPLDESTWSVPASRSRMTVARDYTYLGMQHIWEGIDHLLFLGGLMLIARTGRRILITVTGFTLAHSLTLALATLDVVTVPVPPVEAVIALSIVFLATEIARGDRNGLTYKYPITVSASFGLLHGFGFAAVLKDVGLPQMEIPAALLFFNVGVEIGQVIFVAVLIISYKIFAKFGKALNLKRFAIYGRGINAEKSAAYAIGTLASYWMILRIHAFWQ